MLDIAEKDRRERNRAADEGYEVEVLAKLTSVPRATILKLVMQYGKDRETIMRQADLYKRNGSLSTF